MKRSEFLGLIFKSAVLVALGEQSRLLSEPVPKFMMSVDPACSMPGKTGNYFKIKLNRAWFVNGDIIKVENCDHEFLYRAEKETAQLQSIVEDINKKVIVHVEFDDSDQLKQKVYKIASAFIES